MARAKQPVPHKEREQEKILQGQSSQQNPRLEVLLDPFTALRKRRFLAGCALLMHYGVTIILVLMPFHAVLSTWAGTSLGGYLWFKAWKEILLGVMGLAALGLLTADKSLRQSLLRQKVNILIAAYILLHLLVWRTLLPELDAAAAGLLMNLRFLVLFGLVQVAAYYLPARWSAKRLVTLVLLPAAVVVLFGVLQLTVLPNDFLRHFGYGPDTIEPFLTIDEKDDLVRINSTLRGPNPLGAYLIVPIAMCGYVFLKRYSRRLILGLVPIFTVLFFSHSRSAWLGTAAALVVLVLLTLKKTRIIRLALIAIPVFALLGLLLFVQRDSYFVQNTLFHTDENSTSPISSNDAHWQASRAAAEDVLAYPLGQGPGSAGPASFYNDETGVKLAENYYLQIGQEVGVLGLVLFAAINFLVVRRLWAVRRDFWPAVLLASFAGIFVVNLFLHGWADDTLGLVWWGVAGAAYAGSAIIRPSGATKIYR